MQIANVWVTTTDLGDNARILGVTPPEAIIIRNEFGLKTDGEAEPTNPITHLDIVGEVDRSNAEEFQRLTRKYGKKKLETYFPGRSVKFDTTFKESGFEATEEKTPKSGKLTEVIDLAKLPKSETQDEQSVKEAEERALHMKALAAQGAQIAQLTAAVAALTTHLVGKAGENAVPEKHDDIAAKYNTPPAS